MKTTQQFNNEILLPIQTNLVDTNKLYVLLGILHPDIDKEWPLPSGNVPGSFRYYGEDHLPKLNEFYKKIRLYTISGLLWGNTNSDENIISRSKLYRAEYIGESNKLDAGDFNIALSYNIPKAVSYISSYIPLGFSVKKARLLREINTWTINKLKSFGLDCADRVYQNWAKRYKERSHIFEFMIWLTRAEISDESGRTHNAVDLHTGIKNNKEHQMKYINEKRTELIQAAKELGSLFVGEAIGAAEKGNFFKAASMARMDTAWEQDADFKKIRDDYEFSKDPEFNNILFYTYWKKELDWQVTHLNDLLGEE